MTKLKCIKQVHGLTVGKVYDAVVSNSYDFIDDDGNERYHSGFALAGCFEVVEEEPIKREGGIKAIPTKPKKAKKWSEWIENTTGKCPEGLKRKQKIKLKWGDGDKFVIDNPKDAAWYFSDINITHYKVKLKDQLLDKQEKPESKWTKNTGVRPVEGNITVRMKFSDGTIAKTQAQEYCWDLGQSRKIIKWRLAD